MAVTTQDIITALIVNWLDRGIITPDRVKRVALLLSQFPASFLVVMLLEEHSSKIENLLGYTPTLSPAIRN